MKGKTNLLVLDESFIKENICNGFLWIGSNFQLKIMELLLNNQEREFTAYRIMKLVDCSISTAYNLLKELSVDTEEDPAWIDANKIGKKTFYKANKMTLLRYQEQMCNSERLSNIFESKKIKELKK